MATKKAVAAAPTIVRRKTDSERRGELIKVLATTDERAAFQAAADAAGMSLSTWLRHVAIKASKTSG
jgi:Mobilization protein NikA